MNYRKPSAHDDKFTITQAADISAPKQQAEAPGTNIAAIASTVPGIDVNALSGNEESEIPPALHARFEAFEFLGQGGMGTVYKARDIRLGRDVAVKLIFGADPQLGGNLLREARAQARIDHENVCEVYEAGTMDQVRFIVMQLIRGQSLDKAKAAMTLEEKVRIIRQIADALHEAHRLGMVHRDVKPANIMVERGDDGTWKPYIMDFGLARDIGDSGSTVSGALMGTPSFMAPEQAEGKVRSLDRRTDVYCLGATLYDVLVGHPPHVKDGLAPLLQAIIFDEPLSPRQIDRNLPLDLDAIVMRCLSKQSAMRYESAKALSEELQRFLDGEPVEALRRARLYAFWRGVKRHKIKLSIFFATLVVTSIFVTGWFRARHKAEVQANLSRELGENVKEMEFFLRNAHGLPLHDLDREHKIVRQRLEAIKATMNAAGDIGLGPGHYALGRGFFALQEPKETVAHLQQAELAGYSGAGLDYALGVALTEIYQKELAATKRMDGEQKKQRLAKLDAEYKKPALARLAAALGGKLETPAYAEGLIAYYEERYDDALAKARQAFQEAPWFYEAKKLEGDALFAMGRKFGHDAAFDFEKMTKWFGEANVAYRMAAEIGRSDPKVHLALCELQTQFMCGTHAHAGSMRPAFDAANAACNDAIAASPSNGAAYSALADVHAQFAWRLAGAQVPGEDPAQALTDATKYAENAAQKSADDAIAHYVVGAAWRARALYDVDRGFDEGEAIDRAIEAYDRALKIDSTFLWALNESGSAFLFRAERELRHGREVTNAVNEGLERCDKATKIDAAFVYAKTTAINLRLTAIRQAVAHGQWPIEEVKAALELIAAVKKQAPKLTAPHYRLVELGQLEATFALEQGKDPAAALARVESATKDFAQLAPTSTANERFQGDLATLRARISFECSEDPSSWIEMARRAFDKTVHTAPWDLGYRIRRAAVESLALRWTLQQGKTRLSHFDEARAPLLAFLDVQRDDPRLYQVLGEIGELQSRFLTSQKKDSSQATTDALAHLGRALAIHPRMTSALTCKARLLLLQANQETTEAKKIEIAKQALQAFEAAMRVDSTVERREQAGIEEAHRLIAMH